MRTQLKEILKKSKERRERKRRIRKQQIKNFDNFSFDEANYLRLNFDVRRAVQEGRQHSGFDHFSRDGVGEVLGSPWRVLRFKLNDKYYDYDEKAYRAQNADVEAMIVRGIYKSGLDHFVQIGYRECNDGLRSVYAPCLFIKRLDEQDGAAPLSKQRRYLALFAHYDRDNVIDNYVLTYLAALRRLGVDIVFITSTTAEEEISKIRAMVFKIILKNDAGRDFGSWNLALESIREDFRMEYDYLLFINDSVYFPVTDPEIFFKNMDQSKFDFWGATDSYELCYHLQSYFLAFNKKAQRILLPWFVNECASTPYMTKAGQIFSLEMELAQRALEAGLAVGAYCSIDDIHEDVVKTPELAKWRHAVQLRIDNLNPTHRIWDLLIRHYAFPMLKIELLRDNPLSVDIKNWKGFIDPKLLKANLVESHLERMLDEPAWQPVKLAASARKASTQIELKQIVEGRGFGHAKNLVMLAHYDKQEIIDPYVENSIHALRNNNCDVALITSTTEAAEIERMRSLCSAIVIKNEVGRDFGSWFVGGQGLNEEFGKYDNIIWMNDSTYFPLFDLRKMFIEMENNGSDFWGIVDSLSSRWHIMSWFWFFRRDLLVSGWPLQHIGEFDPSFSKWDQIKNYEMRLPSSLKRAGYKVDTYISADEVVSSHGRAKRRVGFNMHDFWEKLIREFHCPAIKIELLRDNPLGLDIKNVLKVIEQCTSYDTNLIRNHLKRVKSVH